MSLSHTRSVIDYVSSEHQAVIKSFRVRRPGLQITMNMVASAGHKGIKHIIDEPGIRYSIQKSHDNMAKPRPDMYEGVEWKGIGPGEYRLSVQGGMANIVMDIQWRLSGSRKTKELQ